MSARVKKFEISNGSGLANRFKYQVLEQGRVVHESDWHPNLILDQGMNNLTTTSLCNLFLYAVIGTGTTPTQDDSGGITGTGDGTTVTSSSALFAAGDVGKLLRFDSGSKAMITAYTDNQHVTCSAVQVSGQHFIMYRVAQVGLTTEVHRSNTYLTGAGNCGSSWSGNTLTHVRTYDFPIEVSNQAYNEIGFSNSGTVTTNLNMRALLPGAPVSVLIGQQLRVIYQVLFTLNPTAPVAGTASISGWPSLQHSVVASSVTSLITLVAHGFAANTQVFLNGTTPPAGLAFNTVYYVVPNNADTFYLSATSGGGAITLTSNGAGLILFTNTNGSSQLVGAAYSAIDTSGNTTQPNGFPITEPYGLSSAASFLQVELGTDTTPFATWAPSTNDFSPFYTLALAAGTYVAGSFTRTAGCTIPTGGGNSSAIRKIGFGVQGASVMAYGIVFFFSQPQEKTNLYTLNLTARWTWDRVFI